MNPAADQDSPGSMPAEHEAQGIADRLRRTCRSAHARLHHHPLLAPLLGEAVTRPGYVAALQAFQRFYAWIEAGLLAYESANAPAFRYAPRRKLPWLDADLRALGAVPLPALQRPPLQLHDEAAYLGACYVVEGSTLGGRVIATQVGRRLGLTRDRGLSFFLSYGPDVDARWAEFSRHLERHQDDADAAIASALAVYAEVKAVVDASVEEERD